MLMTAEGNHSLAVTDDGDHRKVWAWGWNYYGQLGNATTSGDTPNKLPVQVRKGDSSSPDIYMRDVIGLAAGYSHSIALKADGSIYGWGRNNRGQVGDGTTTLTNIPKAVSGMSSGSGVFSVSADYEHSIAIKVDGSVWIWGEHTWYQLGIGQGLLGNNSYNKSSPVQVVEGESPGVGGYFNLFNNDNYLTGTVTVKLNGFSPAITLPAVAAHVKVGSGVSALSALSTRDGTYIVTGLTEGSAQTLTVTVPGCVPYTTTVNIVQGENTLGNIEITQFASVDAAGWHTLTVSSDTKAWAWGCNTSGQIGDGSLVHRNSPATVKHDASTQISTVTSVSGGYDHAMYLKSNGTVWVAGFNKYGQIGNGTKGDTQYVTIPSQVRKGASSSPDDYLQGIVAIAAGSIQSFALKSNGTLWGWGYNYEGELGDGTNGSGSDKLSPVQVKKGTSSSPDAYLQDVIAVAAGDWHTLALKSDGTVWAWGWNKYGQVGDDTEVDKNAPVQVKGLTDVIMIAAGEDHSLAVRADGSVWAWGRGEHGRLGNNSTNAINKLPVQVLKGASSSPDAYLRNVISISGGRRHSLAVRSDGSAWGWGSREVGQVGDGTTSTTPRQTPVAVSGMSSGVISISANYAHSAALKSDGYVWTWGENKWYQLGNGRDGGGSSSSEDKNAPVQVVGGAQGGSFLRLWTP
jgi:alpha-tubulin suppressor-like RCC1 family protein